MATSLRNAAYTLAVVGLAALPAQAHAQSFEAISSALRAGDKVEITDWGGTRTRGQIAELTPCSIAVAQDGSARRFDASAVETIKLLRRLERSPARTTDAGARCQEAPCMAMSLALAGTTAMGRGLSKLFARPQTVYRAPDRLRASAQCSAQAVPVERMPW